MAADPSVLLAAIEDTLTNRPGVTSCNVEGETISFSSIGEMLQARDRLKSEIALANGTRRRTSSIYLGGF